MHALNICSLDTVDGHPAWPQLHYVARERIDTHYERRSGVRSDQIFTVQLCTAGRLLVDIAGREELCRPGQALCFRTGLDELRYRAEPGCSYASTYVETGGEAAIGAAGGLIARHGHIIDGAAEHAAWKPLLALVPKQQRGQRVLPAAVHHRLFSDLLQALIEANSTPLGQDQRLLAEAMQLMRERIADAIDVGIIAQQLGVARERLSRAFSAISGVGPATWLRRERLTLATALLRDPDLAVAEVATRCGFASPSHFIERFRRRYGQTPDRWRR